MVAWGGGIQAFKERKHSSGALANILGFGALQWRKGALVTKGGEASPHCAA
jgi:hypothetical protein